MSRLPPPPVSGGKKGARPLPPAPTETDGDVPPPLPARPPGPGAPRGMQPPPARPPPDLYLEPEAWSEDIRLSRVGPALPPRNFETKDFSSDDDEIEEDEQATYEEPEHRQPTPPPAPPPSRKVPPVVQQQQSVGGEIYDDLDEVIEANAGEETYEAPDEGGQWQQETYDECTIKEAKPPAPSQGRQEEFQDELYELPPDESIPPPQEELIEETEYEFVPEAHTPSPPPPPVPRVLPPPPAPSPSLPARPPPSRKESNGELTPDLPGRPGGGAAKKQSSGAGPGMGISPGDLSKIRLRKVSSEDKKEPSEGSEGPSSSDAKVPEADSFQGRMNMFKKAEAMSPMSAKTFFNKPALPVKPSIVSNTPKSKLGTPPPPPSKQPGSDETVVPPQVNGTPSSQKSPPRSNVGTKKPESPPPPPPEEELIEEDIYDEGISFKPPPPDPLAEFPWYHFDCDRHISDSKLNSIGQDGSFMVRKSQRGGPNQPYTLVVLYKGHVYNLKVRKRPDTQVALGEEKHDELAFKDVPALITYHRNNDVVLVNTKEKKQYKTLLTKFPSYT